MKEQRLTWLHGKGRPEIGIIGIATHGIHQCLSDCGELIDTLQHQLRQSHEGLTCIGKEALRLGCPVKRLLDSDGPASVSGPYQPDPARHRRFHGTADRKSVVKGTSVAVREY